jgi:hypothetical protein
MMIREPRGIPKVGERIRFRLHAGREVDGVVRAILKTPSGTKLRLEYGSGPYFASITLDEINWSPRDYALGNKS